MFLWTPELDAQDGDSIGAVAAKQFYQEGMRAAQAGDFDRASAKFTQAISADPARAEYRAALSAVYLEKSQPLKAWQQAREAMKTGGGDARIADQTFAVWNALGATGLFQAGKDQSTLRSALGEPDRINKSATNERWFYGFMAIDWAEGQLYSTIDLRGLEPAHLIPTAKVVLQPDSRWRVEYRVADRSQQTTHYFQPEAEKTGEQLVIQRIFQLAEQGVAARQLMERLQRSAQREISDIDWNIVEETEDRIIYEWHHKAYGDQPAKHEIAVVMSDGRDLHHVSYSDEVEELAADKQSQWLDRFRSLTLRRIGTTESIPTQSLAPAD